MTATGALGSIRHRGATAAARADLAELPARLDEIDAWIAEGVLGGDELNAADFQIAPERRDGCRASRTSRRSSPAGRRRRTRCGSPASPRHAPAVFPEDWLRPLRSAAP